MFHILDGVRGRILPDSLRQGAGGGNVSRHRLGSLDRGDDFLSYDLGHLADGRSDWFRRLDRSDVQQPPLAVRGAETRYAHSEAEEVGSRTVAVEDFVGFAGCSLDQESDQHPGRSILRQGPLLPRPPPCAFVGSFFMSQPLPCVGSLLAACWLRCWGQAFRIARRLAGSLSLKRLNVRPRRCVLTLILDEGRLSPFRQGDHYGC